MENLIGRNCKGFKYNKINGYNEYMDQYIDKIGKIVNIKQLKNKFTLKFDDNFIFYYPLSEIHKHLIALENEIPTLEEGKLMLVSDDIITWYEKKVIARDKNGRFLIESKYNDAYLTFNFAKELETEEIVELTLKDISEGKGVGVKPSLIRIKE